MMNARLPLNGRLITLHPQPRPAHFSQAKFDCTMISQTLHITLHFFIPGVAVWTLRLRPWKRAWLIMASTMVVDLDHLLADPIYDPERCSIGFHPLHTYPAITLYLILCFIPKTRIIGYGLIIHMVLDKLDCII